MLLMTSTLKNLLLILAVITVGYGAYYVYSLRASTTAGETTDAEYQTMLSRTEAFIARKQELDRMQLDFSVFEDPAFNALQSYTEPVDAGQVGRSNPFAATGSGI